MMNKGLSCLLHHQKELISANFGVECCDSLGILDTNENAAYIWWIGTVGLNSDKDVPKSYVVSFISDKANLEMAWLVLDVWF